MHLGTLVRDMEVWGGGVAVVEHRGVRRFATSYGELARLSRRFAAELERRAIAPGERVVVWGGNSAGWVAAFFGCVLRGVLPVPLDASGSVEFAERIVGEVSPRLVVGDRALLSRLPVPVRGSASLALETLETALPREPGRTVELRRGSPLQILFTSGTTGEPKGVVQTHGNLLASLGPIEREVGKYRRYERWVHPLRFLHTLPLSHVFGQFMGLWVPPLLGATVHYESRGTASRLAELIPAEGVHVLAAVPRTLALLRAHLLAQDPALAGEIEAAQGEAIARRWWRFRRVHRALGLRFWAAVCGGATLSEELERFWTTLGFALVQGYGLTETSALVTLNHPFRTARGSLGKPLPGRELRLGVNGELEVRGEMVATGSWREGRLVTRGAGNEWLPTGDLAAFDVDGRVRFLGRTGQRLVTAAGLNVYLQDVEQALEREPGLQGAVALALPDGAGGEEPGAVVLAHAGRGAAAAAVARANGVLAAHQQVRRWWLWPGLELPRTATGKVQRRTVESWARAQVAGVAPGERGSEAGGSRPGDAGDPLVALLKSVGSRRGGGAATDAARLDEDWGLDSMGRVALTAALEEQLGLALSDRQAAELQTLGDLRALVRGRRAAEEKAGARQEAPVSEEPHGGRTARERSTEAGREAREPKQGERERLGNADGRWREVQARYTYPAWPWSWPVAGLRLLFTEGFARPLVRLLAAPQVRFVPGLLVQSTVSGTLAGHALLDGPLDGLPDSPVLLISNHRTAMDVPLLLYALPFARRRRLAVAMSGEMLAGWQQSWSPRRLPAGLAEHRRWWGPPAALLLKALLNVFPLPRTSGFRRSFAHAGRALDRGYNVLIFPEGRRSAEESTGRFKPGLGILAQEALVPVLPMALSIAVDKGGRWFRSRPRISVGSPVAVELSAGARDPERLTEQLREAVERLRSD